MEGLWNDVLGLAEEADKNILALTSSMAYLLPKAFKIEP